MNRFSALALALLALAAGALPAHAQARQGVLIGTAAPGGVYAPLGGSICRLFNFTTERHGLRCATAFSEGSVANIAALRAGETDVAIVQSDVLEDAIEGTGPFKDAGPWPALRVLFTAHDEPFTIVAARGSGIASSADIYGKRVNVGASGSGYRLKMERLMAADNLSRSAFAEVLELSPEDQVQALCAGRLDLIVYSVGHPNGLIQEATTRCGGTIVPVPADRVRTLLERHREYRTMTVPGGLYAGHADPIATFGTSAVVVTTAALADKAAYELVRSVFDDFEEFVRLHPAFTPLTARACVRPVAYAAFHPAVLRYYQERGLMP